MLEPARIVGVSKTGYGPATPRRLHWRRGSKRAETKDISPRPDPQDPGCRRARRGRRDRGQLPVAGILLTDDDRLGYLASALTSTRPWLGHRYNTPHFDDRQNKLAAFKSTTAAGDLLEEVDLALTNDPRVIRRLQDSNWQNLSTHGPLQLWQKP
jgi:hypothetical protein